MSSTYEPWAGRVVARDGEGQFAESGGQSWIQKLSDRIGRPQIDGEPSTNTSRRKPGRDVTDDLASVYANPATNFVAIRMQRVGAHVDGGLSGIAQLQGWGPPEVTSSDEVQRRIDAGWTPMYRGVVRRAYWDRPNEDVPATSIVDSLRYDNAQDFMYGVGIFGNGVFFSDNEEVGQAFANLDRDHPGVVVRAALDPDARIIEYEEVERLLDEYRRAQSAAHASGSAHPEDMRFKLFRDPGRLAAALGYDAIVVPAGNTNGVYDSTDREYLNRQYVVLNRSAMVIEEVNR